jgi:hypothetical protein
MSSLTLNHYRKCDPFDSQNDVKYLDISHGTTAVSKICMIQLNYDNYTNLKTYLTNLIKQKNKSTSDGFFSNIWKKIKNEHNFLFMHDPNNSNTKININGLIYIPMGNSIVEHMCVIVAIDVLQKKFYVKSDVSDIITSLV